MRALLKILQVILAGLSSTDTFDFPEGAIKETTAFNALFGGTPEVPLPEIDYDAKLSENYENRASLLKKALKASESNAGTYLLDDISLTNFKRQGTTEELLALPRTDTTRNSGLLQRLDELDRAKRKAGTVGLDENVVKLITDRVEKQRKKILDEKKGVSGSALSKHQAAPKTKS